MTLLLISLPFNVAYFFFLLSRRREGVRPAEGAAEAKTGRNKPGRHVLFCVSRGTSLAVERGGGRGAGEALRNTLDSALAFLCCCCERHSGVMLA